MLSATLQTANFRYRSHGTGLLTALLCIATLSVVLASPQARSAHAGLRTAFKLLAEAPGQSLRHTVCNAPAEGR